MSNQRWKAKWKADDIAFHQHEIHPHLIRFWPQLALATGTTVLVPLCGKSLDLGWLHQQGHRVIGVELSHIAIAAYFAERGLLPQRQRLGRFQRYWAGTLELWCGDLFDLRREDLGEVAAVYDCAALTALPAASRGHYVRQLSSLLGVGGQMLLLTTESADEPAEVVPAATDQASSAAMAEVGSITMAETAPAATAQADACPADADHSPDPEVLGLYQSRFAIALLYGHSCLKMDPEYPGLPASLLAEKVYHLGPRV
jgi:thiopurine S-methyltransferase